MNLMTQAIENIYKYGNTTLHLDRYNCKVIFNVGNDNKLNIRVEFNYGNLIDKYDLSTEEGLPHISYLVYYSFVDLARKRDNVYLTSDIGKKAELTIVAVNELYRQLIPIISTERRYIEALAKSDVDYQVFANSSRYDDNNSNILSIKDIMEILVKGYDEFKKALINACRLWKKTGTGNIDKSNDAFNNWNNFLNQLYIAQLFDPSKIDLNSLNIDYEFLTSKNYLSNPAIACEEEIEELEIALLTPSKSVILVGPPGVGKTAIIEGLAYKISRGQVSPVLKNKQILKINTSSLVRGCTLVGMFEEKVEKLMKYLSENPDTILFVDEIHTAIGAGLGSKGNLDLANIMKPYIDRGQVKVIGATTEEEYEEHFKSDKAFNRRFQKISISESQKSSVYQIIEKTIVKLEKTTGIKWNFDIDISKMIISHIIKCTDEKHRVYNDKRYNPDISISILENSFARALQKGNDSITIDNVADAIRKSDFLYESVRTNFANQLLSKYQSIASCKHTPLTRCKIIKFPPSEI